MTARRSASFDVAAAEVERGGAFAPSRFSMAAMMVSKIFLRAYHFDVASTMVHGAYSRIGVFQHLFGGGQILVVLLVARPIGIGHPPGFQRVRFNRLESLLSVPSC